MKKLWAPGATPLAPRTFKLKLAHFAPQFSGFNQHDSQVCTSLSKTKLIFSSFLFSFLDFLESIFYPLKGIGILIFSPYLLKLGAPGVSLGRSS